MALREIPRRGWIALSLSAGMGGNMVGAGEFPLPGCHRPVAGFWTMADYDNLSFSGGKPKNGMTGELFCADI